MLVACCVLTDCRLPWSHFNRSQALFLMIWGLLGLLDRKSINRAYQEQSIDVELLNGIEILPNLKLGKIDHLVSSVCSRMTYDNQGVDMTLW